MQYVRKLMALGSVCAVLLVVACSSEDPAGPAGADAGAPADAAPAPDAPPPTEFGGDRPVTLRVPASYDPATPAPLVLALHGYSGDGAFITGYTRFDQLVDAEGILLVAPDGTFDSDGERFWNATDACCDLEDMGVDDVSYLLALLADIRAAYAVDPARIYVVGNSNGGFMAYRLACEAAGQIAAVISLAGATFADAADCTPSEPVSVLQIHGTADQTIAYAGGTLAQGDETEVAYPSASATVETWATYAGCSGVSAESGATLNLDGLVAGAETSVATTADCPAGIDAELWTAAGSGHIIAFSGDVPGALWTWLEAHPKPAE